MQLQNSFLQIQENKSIAARSDSSINLRCDMTLRPWGVWTQSYPAWRLLISFWMQFHCHAICLLKQRWKNVFLLTALFSFFMASDSAMHSSKAWTKQSFLVFYLVLLAKFTGVSSLFCNLVQKNSVSCCILPTYTEWGKISIFPTNEPGNYHQGVNLALPVRQLPF